MTSTSTVVPVPHESTTDAREEREMSTTGARTADWSIQEVARLAGTTSRTLRHYDAVGLLPPSRVAANGYRHYDADALVRLQRCLFDTSRRPRG